MRNIHLSVRFPPALSGRGVHGGRSGGGGVTQFDLLSLPSKKDNETIHGNPGSFDPPSLNQSFLMGTVNTFLSVGSLLLFVRKLRQVSAPVPHVTGT